MVLDVPPPPAPAPIERREGCRTKACEIRVSRRRTRRRWRIKVDAYGRGLLARRLDCESGSSGGYALSTTGNGYWFAYQFDTGAWAGAGGKMKASRPVGAWTVHPTALEQDYRAARWDAIHGGDPWPNCP